MDYEEQIDDFAGRCPHCGKQYNWDQRWNTKGNAVPYHKYSGQRCPGVGNEFARRYGVPLWKDMDTEIVAGVGVVEKDKCTPVISSIIL